MPSSRLKAFRLGCLCLLALPAGRAMARDEAADAGPRAAESDAASTSESLIKQGIELRKRGDDRGALEAFEQASALDASAQALAQLALAEQALGRWREAHLHLEAALAHGTDPWISANRPTLEGAREEIASRLGSLEITCNVGGAEVQLDGLVAGHTPLPGTLKWVAGESALRVSAPGYFVVIRQVKIDAGGLARVDVMLTPGSGVALPPEAAAPQLRPGSPDPPVTSKPRPMQPPAAGPALSSAEQPSSTRDILMYTSLGLAGLGITVGITGYVIHEINAQAYNDDARCDTRPELPRSAECKSEAGSARTGEALAVVGFSATGAFGLTALLLWLGRTAATDDRQVACNIGALFIGCNGQF